jgi:uncharacterized protein YbcI
VADEQHLPRLETAYELEASGADVVQTPLCNDSLRGRISHAMVGMKKDFYGKGPTKAKTFINDEYVFVVMEGGLTRNEEVLLAAGQHDLVRAYRLRFQEAMTDTTIAAVEEILGRKVLTYHSQILFHPERAIEIFVLDSQDD